MDFSWESVEDTTKNKQNKNASNLFCYMEWYYWSSVKLRNSEIEIMENTFHSRSDNIYRQKYYQLVLDAVTLTVQNDARVNYSSFSHTALRLATIGRLTARECQK